MKKGNRKRKQRTVFGWDTARPILWCVLVGILLWLLLTRDFRGEWIYRSDQWAATTARILSEKDEMGITYSHSGAGTDRSPPNTSTVIPSREPSASTASG